MNEMERVISESEEFLRLTEGARECRMVNALEFIDIVDRNELTDRVKLRKFILDHVPHTQVYVELNGEHIYSIIID